MQQGSAPAFENSVRQVIEAGAELTGDLAACAIGFLLGGPVGGVVGAVGASAIKQTLIHLSGDAVARTLSRRERVRIGTVVTYAADKIRNKLANGATLRNDGFLDETATGRSDADEVAEGIILISEREHEERKLPYYGNLLANLAFTPGVDRAYANYLVRTAQTLSYRQLCLLLLFVVKAKLPLRKSEYRNDLKAITAQSAPVLLEVYDLYTRQMLNGGGSALLGVTDVNPSAMEVQAAGVQLFQLMELNTLSQPDVLALVSPLS
jgi:hypothetical protein